MTTRREALVATLLSPFAVVASEPESRDVIVDATRAETLVLVRTSRRLNHVQQKQITEQLCHEGKRVGCRIMLFSDCDEIVVMELPGLAKYGFTEKLGDYSFSLFCQTADELQEWLPQDRKLS